MGGRRASVKLVVEPPTHLVREESVSLGCLGETPKGPEDIPGAYPRLNPQNWLDVTRKSEARSTMSSFATFADPLSTFVSYTEPLSFRKGRDLSKDTFESNENPVK